jgi:hypothetical protein
MSDAIAKRRLKQFQHKFGEAMVEFASHAALPVVLNSELVHLLRLNFFFASTSIDYLTEAELLLSSFCREIGEDLYEIEPAIRTVLLERLSQQNPERIKEIAALLWQYTKRYTPWQTRKGLQNAQLLTALNFLDAQKATEWFQEVERSHKALSQEDREWFVAMKKQIENIFIDSEEPHTKPIAAGRDALVVGITQYADLPMALEITILAEGAEKIAQLLETKGGFRLRRLPVTKQGDKEFIDPEQLLTATQLKSAIEQLLIPESNNPPGTALIFFAGHGLRKKNQDGSFEGFLATSEANPNENNWGISLQWLRALLQQSPVQQQIVWIDACHSGELFNFNAHDVHDRCFISSAMAFEEAYAEGILTNALLESLDYTKQLNSWVDNDTLVELLKKANEKAPGSQRFLYEQAGKPIILTNLAFDLNQDYRNVCPFKGLESFDFEKNPDDPLYFKGRAKLTQELLEKVQSANFLAVLGVSSSGKSSVVRAGLLYQLRQTQRWQILPVITPTSHPLTALATAIGMPAQQLTNFINREQTERLVLVIDQFEEVFTLCQNNEEREQFLATLLAAGERADKKFCLVIVMRADFLDQCSHHLTLAKKIQAHQIIVTPMTKAELEEAIVAPIKQVGLQIEPKLVSEMLADVKGVLGSLPLLQYTLTELWKKCAPQRLLTFSAYEELGKIRGTLAQGADSIYQGLSVEEQRIAKRIFLGLTQLGEGTSDSRRQLDLQYLVTSLPFESALINQVIQKLVTANLLVIDKLKEEQTAVINITHEALIQHWSLLREWITENRDLIKLERKLSFYAAEWESYGRNKELLLRGPVLVETNKILKEHAVILSVLTQHFVTQSIKNQKPWWKFWA